jgi:16S rRNA (cytosine1402-N4)-methyltransferase
MVLDLGVSAMQIDVPERGFSFQKKGPLDMRMGANALSAAEVVNTFPEEQISEILWTYGEEPKSRAIARKIVEARRKRPLQTTWDLQRLVASVVRGSPLRDPATRTFQALRIFVNDELGELQKALLHAEKYLKAGGRLVVVAFHSLEDRLVKRFLNGPEAPVDPISGKPLPGKGPFAPLYKKPMTPSEEEKRMHPRARSAKMRVGVKQP